MDYDRWHILRNLWIVAGSMVSAVKSAHIRLCNSQVAAVDEVYPTIFVPAVGHRRQEHLKVVPLRQEGLRQRILEAFRPVNVPCRLSACLQQ